MGGLAYGSAFGLAFGATFGAAVGAASIAVHGAPFGSWATFRVVSGLAAGLVAGLAFGLGLSMGQTAWPSYTLTRERLALYHRLPRSLMNFLSDAHQRGVLRQAGAVYQFRHIELQHRLANRDAGK
jgi:hypothetical protein